jgi:hypothetical protein
MFFFFFFKKKLLAPLFPLPFSHVGVRQQVGRHIELAGEVPGVQGDPAVLELVVAEGKGREGGRPRAVFFFFLARAGRPAPALPPSPPPRLSQPSASWAAPVYSPRSRATVSGTGGAERAGSDAQGGWIARAPSAPPRARDAARPPSLPRHTSTPDGMAVSRRGGRVAGRGRGRRANGHKKTACRAHRADAARPPSPPPLSLPPLPLSHRYSGLPTAPASCRAASA